MHGSLRRVGPGLAVALTVPSIASAQTVQYAYDAAGRLGVVADLRGDLAVYQYDAAGNLLAIQRITVGDVPDAVVIAHVSPGSASRDATVSIFGKGFGATPPANALTFNDVPAVVATASPTRLTARVPASATTGPIRLTTPLGTASWPTFHVLDALSVTPVTALVAPHGSVRFTASGGGTPGVRWSVDRVAGGDAQRGTITGEGVYRAPEMLPPGGVRITATSVLDPGLEATAHVGMLTSRPSFVAAEPVGVTFAALPPRVELTATASVGVATSTGFAMAMPLVVRVAPVVFSTTPSTAGRGETLRLRVTGAGFEGATRLQFWTAAGPDVTVTATGLVISADGDEATADVAVAVDAASGPRVVRIVTPTASSGDAVPGENVFSVR